ncbi:Uncharacterised protein [Yersinia massiliensis]|nr:Uncharacterised protein [Yersinia massiliensis]
MLPGPVKKFPNESRTRRRPRSVIRESSDSIRRRWSIASQRPWLFSAGLSTTISVRETIAIRLLRSGVVSKVWSSCNSDIALSTLSWPLSTSTTATTRGSLISTPRRCAHSMSAGEISSVRIKFSTSSSRKRLSCASKCTNRACSIIISAAMHTSSPYWRNWPGLPVKPITPTISPSRRKGKLIPGRTPCSWRATASSISTIRP